MEDVLFSGVRIDKKRFSGDIAKFQPPNKRKRIGTSAVETGVVEKKKKKKSKLHVSGQDAPQAIKTFAELEELGCEEYLMQNIQKAGYTEPTPIQKQVIPTLLKERECFACAPTGSGKSLAFLLPILMKLEKPSTEGIRALILSPTRELARQITVECERLSKGRKFVIRHFSKKIARTSDVVSCDILIATPLRLKYSLKSSQVDLSCVQFLILDESDKLFELGFLEQLDAIASACTGESVVRALFSATLPDAVEELARTIMHDPIRITVGERNSAADTLEQKLLFAGTEEGKLLALKQSFKEQLEPPIIIFVQEKERAEQLHRELKLEDLRVNRIHADRTQAQRDTAVENFRLGKTWILIATDLMARGMDFKGVNCVINYDLPQDAITYIHRIGRSGRAGRSGKSLTLYSEEDIPQLRAIANVMKSSGCEVPEWMFSLERIRSKDRKQLRRRPVGKS